MLRRGSLVSKVFSAIVGGSLVVAGVILLVLPGPGVVVVAAGFAVLAREFTWAARPLRLATERARQGLQLVADKPLAAAADAAAGLGLIGVAVADLVVGLPLLSALSDAFIILGGAFLLGTVVYARRNRRPVTTGR